MSSSATRTGASSPFWSQQRTFDNAGNILQLSTTLPTVSGGGSKTDNQSFCYDALDRLTWAGNTGTPSGGDHCGLTPTGSTTYSQSFSYDALDRMTSGSAGTESYSDPSHVHAATGLSSVTNLYASYDAMGNMTCRNVSSSSSQSCASATQTSATMSYDNEGRLSSWMAPSGTTGSQQYLYDNEGNRVLQQQSTSSGSNSVITFDGFTDTTISTGSKSTTKYYYAGGQTVAEATGTAWYELVPDLLGSAVLALKSNGTIQAVQLYAPYGSSRYTDQVMPTDYNFTGQRLDSQTGLLYYNARYYDPVSGRFISSDMVQNNTKGMDSYAYVGDNPVVRTDPSGKCWPLCTMLIGAAIGAVVGVASTVVMGAISGKMPSGGQIAQVAVTGAVAGAITGLAGPEAGPLARIAAGAVANAAGQAVGNAMQGKPIMDGVGQAAVIGGITGGMMGGEGAAAEKVDEGLQETAEQGMKVGDIVPPEQKLPYTPKGQVFEQQENSSCVAASCKMILSDQGIGYPESYLRSALGTNEDGTLLSNAPQALNDAGLTSPAYQSVNNATADSLQAATSSGNSAIVSIAAQGGFHALVLDGFDESGMALLRDPWVGDAYGLASDYFGSLLSGRAVIPS